MSCAAPRQGDVDTSLQAGADGATVIDGAVGDTAGPVAGAYVRLLDGTGEFVAEVVSGPRGEFRFHVVPGEWTVRALAPGARAQGTISAVAGANWLDVRLGG